MREKRLDLERIRYRATTPTSSADRPVHDPSASAPSLGLNFVEILEGDTSDFFGEPLRWNDMAQVMGKNGMRGPDAMILGLFLKSKFPLLITGDSDIETSFRDSGGSTTGKAILIL